MTMVLTVMSTHKELFRTAEWAPSAGRWVVGGTLHSAINLRCVYEAC